MKIALITPWGDDEVQFLIDNCDKMTDKELGYTLGRSIPSIRSKRHSLNLRKKTNKAWFKKLPMPSKNELVKLYLEEGKCPSRMAQIFHVSLNTILRWLAQYDIPLKRPCFSKVKTNLSEVQKSYFAGYLDGDGTITITYSKNRNRPKWMGFQKDVSLITRVKWFAEELQRLIGGDLQTFIYYDSRNKKEGYKVSFTNQESALIFLREISPYLILKKRQAKSMIEILEERLALRALKGNSAPITPFTWEEAEKIRRWNHE
jgi:hypothetical protein